MSRDWRPCELYLVDYHEKNMLRNAKFTFHTNTGKEIKPSEELVEKRIFLKEHCPELAFMCSQTANVLNPTLMKIDNVIFLLEQIDAILKDEAEKMISATTEKENRNYIDNQIAYYTNLAEQDTELSVKEITVAWFYGALDSNFYYGERNNARFLEYLNDEFTFYKKWETEKVDVDVAIDLSGYADLLPDDR